VKKDGVKRLSKENKEFCCGRHVKNHVACGIITFSNDAATLLLEKGLNLTIDNTENFE
jgi:hypothetical protein